MLPAAEMISGTGLGKTGVAGRMMRYDSVWQGNLSGFQPATRPWRVQIAGV
jgi:hypothetical protein